MLFFCSSIESRHETIPYSRYKPNSWLLTKKEESSFPYALLIEKADVNWSVQKNTAYNAAYKTVAITHLKNNSSSAFEISNLLPTPNVKKTNSIGKKYEIIIFKDVFVSKNNDINKLKANNNINTKLFPTVLDLFKIERLRNISKPTLIRRSAPLLSCVIPIFCHITKISQYKYSVKLILFV